MGLIGINQFNKDSFKQNSESPQSFKTPNANISQVPPQYNSQNHLKIGMLNHRKSNKLSKQ
jgi:hypothetical protein